MNHELRIKKILIALSLLIPTVLLVFNPTKILADGEEVKRGEEIWQKLSTSQLKCENLSDGEFKNLGEFFMERMTGSVANHEVMDQQMEQMMGKEGLDQMHEAMGKRMSGCDPNAIMPGMGMMGMMGSAFSDEAGFGGTEGGGQNMMGSGMMGWGGGGVPYYGMMGQAGGTFWIWVILSWVTWILVIVALVAFIRWMWKKGDK